MRGWWQLRIIHGVVRKGSEVAVRGCIQGENAENLRQREQHFSAGGVRFLHQSSFCSRQAAKAH